MDVQYQTPLLELSLRHQLHDGEHKERFTIKPQRSTLMYRHLKHKNDRDNLTRAVQRCTSTFSLRAIRHIQSTFWKAFDRNYKQASIRTNTHITHFCTYQ